MVNTCLAVFYDHWQEVCHFCLKPVHETIFSDCPYIAILI